MPSIINAATSGGLISTADTSGVLQLQTASTTALTVNASQNVGIGTTSPSYRLTVAAAGTSARIEVNNTSDSNRGGYLRDTGSTFELGTNSGVRPLAFAYDGSEKMRIDSSGNVGIGTTSPQSLLELKSTTGTVTARLNSASGSGREYGLASSSTGGFGIYDFTGSSYVTFINSSGNVSLKNATTSANGIGITFPATQSASSDANTLDDYEEGTFTPTFTSNGGSISAYNSNGFYIKVGRLVFVQLFCNITSVGSASGTLNFSGLPFGVNGVFGANQGQVAALVRESNITGTTYYAYMPGGNSTSGIISGLSGSSITWSSNGIWPVTFTYYTAA